MRLFTRQGRWLLLAVGLAAAVGAGGMLIGCGDGGGTGPVNEGGGANAAPITNPATGQDYRTVEIGAQTWMAENLNHATSTGSWCNGNQESNCVKYGRLYTWNMAKSVCPAGWHLPSDNEWSTLVTAVGGSAATKLKSTSGWNGGGNGTDEYGFAALPGGDRWGDGNGFGDAGAHGAWWTATEAGGSSAYCRAMVYESEDVLGDDESKGTGFSVRCVKN